MKAGCLLIDRPVPGRVCPPVHPPPVAAAALMFIALTNHFYNKENRRGRN